MIGIAMRSLFCFVLVICFSLSSSAMDIIEASTEDLNEFDQMLSQQPLPEGPPPRPQVGSESAGDRPRDGGRRPPPEGKERDAQASGSGDRRPPPDGRMPPRGPREAFESTERGGGDMGPMGPPRDERQLRRTMPPPPMGGNPPPPMEPPPP
ncbi:MAG: hypothetical protein CL675_07535 [Bdellovibrionaceae bacterium]|nr:hypothetical protein [Pseudobdellovibrionaceae bacterium]